MESLEFGAEFVPFAGFGLGGIIEGVNKTTIQTPEERFATRLAESFDRISNIDPGLISQEMRHRIERFAPTMRFMTFKNTTAYVLGCLAVVGPSETIDIKRVEKLLPYFKTTDNTSASDVLRYARFAAMNKF